MLVEKINLKKKQHQYIALLVCFILLISLSIRSFTRTFDWRNEIILSTNDLKIDPNNWVLQNALGNNLFNKGDFKNAEINFNKATIIDPGNNMAWNNLGYLYEQEGAKNKNNKFYQKADKYYQKAIAISKNQTPYVNLAELRLFKEQQNFKSTNNFIKSALVEFPNNSNLLFMYSITLYKLQDKKNALVELQKALKMQPQNKNFLQAHQWINTNTPINLAP
jgi:tetratricopeptide (TPR) repeat protein